MAGSPHTCTIFPRNLVFSAEQLMEQNPRKIMAAFKSTLNRLGIAQAEGFLFAAMHGEFDPTTGLFHLHIHAVADTGMIRVIDRLRSLPNYRRRRSAGEKKQRVRIGRKPITNLPYPLTYILQPYWPCRWRGEINGATRRGKVRHRIPEPYHTILLLWLDRWSVKDMTIMIGMSVNQSGFHLSPAKTGRSPKP